MPVGAKLGARRLPAQEDHQRRRQREDDLPDAEGGAEVGGAESGRERRREGEGTEGDPDVGERGDASRVAVC